MQNLDCTTRGATKIVICFILIAILCVCCIQIYDRYVFHRHIQDSVRIYAQTIHGEHIYQIPSCGAKDSMCINRANSLAPSNYDCQNSHYALESLIDVYSKSDGLLSANGLTLIVSLIVSLLASLLLYRIEKMEKLVEKNRKLEEKTQSYYSRITKFNTLLSRVVSIYNLSIIIGNVSMALSPYKREEENKIISEEIGSLSSRLSRICSQIESRFNERKYKLNYITMEEKNMLDTYLDDATGELERSINVAYRMEFDHLENILKNKRILIEDIKDALKMVEIEEERASCYF